MLKSNLRSNKSHPLRRQFATTTRFADSRMTQKFSDEKLHFNYEETVVKLNNYYGTVKRQILRHQSPTTGLFPCNLADPNSKEAHVRDSVYCAACLWALSQAYRRIDDDKGRTYELSQSAVKCMRGILSCWIRQSDKLEKFKHHQIPKHALHSKFHLDTGDSIYDNEEYEHLQIDCIALYILFLIQMIQSGLQIIFTTDEVNFIQNLVFYVERAYRTPDYGMWERGTKYNNGSSELHASSLGFAKSALEAINGISLFGGVALRSSVVLIDIDAHYRNRTIFFTLLPRESSSKNTDASLLPTISWPAFAIHEEALVKRTHEKILRKLKGNYGLKRFLRDGHGTVLEDSSRKYYKSAEIKTFDGVESEWPIFFVYLLIDSVFRGDQQQVKNYQAQLERLIKYDKNGDAIVPKYYYVPSDCIEEEKANPGSQIKIASSEGRNGNLFLWGQSVYIISQLLANGLLSPRELDHIGRHLPAHKRPRTNARYSSFQSSPTDLVIQCALIAESVRLQQMLATYGIQTQTPHQIEPYQIWPPGQLVKAYEQLGVNSKLGLSGRPPRPFGGLGSAKIYRASGRTFLCYPLIFEISDFYLSQDMQVLIDDIKTDLTFLSKCWKLAGRPTFCMIIREDNMKSPDSKRIFDLLANFKRGEIDHLKIRIGRLQEFISSSCIEHLDFLTIDANDKNTFKHFQEKDYGQSLKSLTNIPRFSKFDEAEAWVEESELQCRSSWDLMKMLQDIDNLFVQSQILHILLKREGLYYKVDSLTVEEWLQNVCHKAGTHQIWAVVRLCSAMLQKMVDSLAPSITAILVRGKQITVGLFNQEEEVIDKPLIPAEIKNILYSKCYPFDLSQAVLQQELIIYIAQLLSSEASLFEGMLKLRIGWIIKAMQLELNYSSSEGKRVSVNSLPPSEIKSLLYGVVKKLASTDDYRSVIWNRQLDGALNRVPKDFYDKVWFLLEKTPGGIKVAGYHLPQQPTLSDMTRYEWNFSLLVEQMLSKIVEPAYRQMIVEEFMIVATILQRNNELSFQEIVNLDKILQEAISLFAKEKGTEDKEELENMKEFYNTPPNVKRGTTGYIARAVISQLLNGEVAASQAQCAIS